MRNGVTTVEEILASLLGSIKLSLIIHLIQWRASSVATRRCRKAFKKTTAGGKKEIIFHRMLKNRFVFTDPVNILKQRRGGRAPLFFRAGRVGVVRLPTPTPTSLLRRLASPLPKPDASEASSHWPTDGYVRCTRDWEELKVDCPRLVVAAVSATVCEIFCAMQNVPPRFFRLGTNNKNKGVCSNYSVKLRGPNTSACRRITSRDYRKICAQVIQPLEECLKTSFWTFLRKVLSTVWWLFYHPPLPDHPLRSSSRIPKRGRSRKRKSEQLSD